VPPVSTRKTINDDLLVLSICVADQDLNLAFCVTMQRRSRDKLGVRSDKKVLKNTRKQVGTSASFP
jgi:hypothetical protein